MAAETTPDGFPTLPILATPHGRDVYAFLEKVFSAKLLDQGVTPRGEIAYMTIRIGDSIVSVMRPIEGSEPTRSAFYVYVTDVDAAYKRAVDAGARPIQEPLEAVHGDRMGTIIDPFDNQWTIATRMEQISIGELHQRLAKQ